ncbi:ThrE domain-containing protein [Mycena indigotica]|uniref:ThrE domain-containing protein n=1 Tax=Mycena indigotica TaxID=2126181 RepID=A0A8H6W762_9AGAR|nr:ThrE domain-containing protein [Mycena indigotica]KAF7301794.1 ThrE domain-containing protein [Mycena indigotica]
MSRNPPISPLQPDSYPQPREAAPQSVLRAGSQQWNIVQRDSSADEVESVEFPIRKSPSLAPPDQEDTRRVSSGSMNTLFGSSSDDELSKRYSFSSYQHPYDIPTLPNAYAGVPIDQNTPPRSRQQRRVSFSDEPQVNEYDQEAQINSSDRTPLKRRGILSNMMDLYALEHGLHDDQPNDSQEELRGPSRYPNRSQLNRRISTDSNHSDLLDPDDPRVTGIVGRNLDDHQELDKSVLRTMDYKSRRKYLMRVKIEFNVSTMMQRQDFLLKLARALMTFGAPSHRIESQLIAAARILEVEAEFIHLPGIIICSFGDQELGCSETHFIKCGGRLSLGALHKVHVIYRSVVHDEISAAEAANRLEALLNAPALYPIWIRCLLSFCLSALICPLAFGGSFLDMWIAGCGALVLSYLQLCAATKSAIYANVFEITIAIFVSFTARGLSSIRSHLFCYSAISSAGIIGILPGYLILSSSLELASKNIVCGSVKMVYALIYTLFLGFGLQIGSDFYLLLDRPAREQLLALSTTLQTSSTLSGTWTADNFSQDQDVVLPGMGTWTFVQLIQPHTMDIVNGCYRPVNFPWYLQPFPLWCSFIIVPLFSLLSSLANLQPWRSRQLPVMVVISCCSYATNKIANHYIFNRSDIVSAIGAFTTGVMGNVYSRRMGGTAFTSMVTGVLFLVPSGLSQAGGITASGNGIDIGGAMIAVTIGITVGLFMSQALVYTFGSRKNAAVFSF